jgi:hypothetical protein
MRIADLPTIRSTHLPRVNQRPGSPIFLRPPIVIRHDLVGSPEGSPLVHRLGLVAVTAVLEYQPVVHRLRLSASP